MYEIRGGNSGFIKDYNVYDGDSGCLRKVLLRHHKIEPPTDGYDPITQKELAKNRQDRLQYAIGYATEEIQSYILKTEGVKVTPNYKVKVPLTNKTIFHGTIDAIHNHPDGPVYEFKTVNTLDRLKEVFPENGTFKWSHAAQLLTYMIATKRTKGELRYIVAFRPKSFKFRGNPTVYKYNLADIKVFYFLLKKDGYVYSGTSINNLEKTEISVLDIMAHQNAKIKVLENNIVWENRPDFYKNELHGCFFCDLKPVCNAYDEGEIDSVKGFLDKTKQFYELDYFTGLELPENIFSITK